MPAFDAEAAARLAALTRIGLADGEAAALAAALTDASAEWDAVRDADAGGIPPWEQAIWGNPWREDVVGESFTPGEATAAAGRAEAGLFLVPEIL